MAGFGLLWKPTFYSVSVKTYFSLLSHRYAVLLGSFLGLVRALESLEEDNAHQESGKGGDARVAGGRGGVILAAGSRNGGNTSESNLSAESRDGLIDGTLDLAADGSQDGAVSLSDGQELAKVRHDLAANFFGALTKDGANKLTNATCLNQSNKSEESDEETHLGSLM